MVIISKTNQIEKDHMFILLTAHSLLDHYLIHLGFFNDNASSIAILQFIQKCNKEV